MHRGGMATGMNLARTQKDHNMTYIDREADRHATRPPRGGQPRTPKTEGRP